jgi:hypothetical protein
MLHSRSLEGDFVMCDGDELRAEVERVYKEILEILWENRYRTVKGLGKGDIERTVCTAQSVLNSVLNLLEQRHFIKGAEGDLGIEITALGEEELDRLRVQSEVSNLDVGQIEGAAAVEDEYDLFISHASEDKNDFVRPLALALRDAGLQVWYDEFSLKLGDSLRESIDHGLASSRYALVILSPHFFAKDWPQKELNGLFAKMTAGEVRILPVWHGLKEMEVRDRSPMLSDLVAANSSNGVEAVAAMIIHVVKAVKAPIGK